MSIQCETVEEYAAVVAHYTANEIWQILERVRCGVASGCTIREVFRSDPYLPSVEWFWQLHLDCAEASQYIDHARKAGAYALADRSVDVALTADDSTAKIARVRMQAMQWVASKHHRERYGDRVQHEVSGSIDLRAAIDAGARRAEQLRPIRDLQPHPDPQAIVNKRKSLDGPSDAQSPLKAIKSDVRPRRQSVIEARKRAKREREREQSPPDEDGIPW